MKCFHASYGVEIEDHTELGTPGLIVKMLWPAVLPGLAFGTLFHGVPFLPSLISVDDEAHNESSSP